MHSINVNDSYVFRTQAYCQCVGFCVELSFVMWHPRHKERVNVACLHGKFKSLSLSVHVSILESRVILFIRWQCHVNEWCGSLIRKRDVPWTDLRVDWLMFEGVVDKDDVLMLFNEQLCLLFKFDHERKLRAYKIKLLGIQYCARAADIWISSVHYSWLREDVLIASANGKRHILTDPGLALTVSYWHRLGSIMTFVKIKH